MAFSVYAVAGVIVVVGLLLQKFTDYLHVLRFKKLHGCKSPPRLPQPERLIGWQFFKIQTQAAKEKRIVKVGRQRFLDHGNTYTLTTMGQTWYNTIEPENVKTILATNFKDFGIGKRQLAMDPLLGRGIFTTDGAQWEHSRALVRPNFTKTQVADLDTFETHIQKLITKIPRDGSTVDLQPLFFQLTLDSATEFLFGESVNSLDSLAGSEQENFGTNFDFGMGRLVGRLRMGRLVHLFSDKEFGQKCKSVHRFVDNIILRALERSQDAEKSIDSKCEKERYVFLDELINATRDPKQLRDELLNILLAGRDTTASLLAVTFHVLARKPDVWNKLTAEVDELHGERPDYETLRNMKYLKYVLNEALRLYPIVPLNSRFAIRDTVIPRGGGPDGQSPIMVRKGEAVGYSLYSMHRRTDIYGADAEEFRPERWAPEEGLRPGWGYLPFNGGPRICVGQQFALTEASYTIVRLLQEFGGIEDKDGSEWREQLSLTMSCGDGVHVAMVPREK